VILADTSAWVEYLRATGRPAHRRLRELIAGDGDLRTTEVVIMELLAGAATAEEVTRLRRLLLRFQLLPIAGLADYEAAAALYRDCRARGETVRSTVDCLIAVVAMRHGATVLHRDHDFEVIARHTPLRVAGRRRPRPGAS
jgi:predicted nucleic acid-binding protein